MSESNPVLEAVEHYAFLRYCSSDDMVAEWQLDLLNAIDREKRNCYTRAFERAERVRDAISDMQQ